LQPASGLADAERRLGRAVPADKVRQTVEDVVGSETPRNRDRQASPRELVDDSEYPKGTFVLGLVLHEVIAPDMVGPLAPSCWKHAFGMTPDT
jgi:hypothetical protein